MLLPSLNHVLWLLMFMRGLKIEFGSAIQLPETGEQRVAQLSVHQGKNRTEEVLPYDHSRVVLAGRDTQSDYINASWCRLPGRQYIVTQGPLESTVADFWWMVWQEHCPAIVMLTKTFDYIRVMSAQYWPGQSGREEQYGRVRVRLVREAHYAAFIQRHLVVTCPTAGQSRHLTHFQFTEWPQFSSPQPAQLLNFRRVVAEAVDGTETPLVIHCQSGGGRSGVFLLLDANIRLASSAARQVNIYSWLSELRAQRAGLVSSQAQYSLLYSLLEQFLVLGHTSLPLHQFLAQQDSNAGEEARRLAQEFARLDQVRPQLSQGDCAGGHRVDNRAKNRSVLVLPPDTHRPYITSFQGNDCTDYINAVFVDGYSRANDFIVTEWPLAGTLANFWSMVYDHDAVTIVVLESDQFHTGNGCLVNLDGYPTFWPETGQSRQFGPVFSVARGRDPGGAAGSTAAAAGEKASEERRDLIEKTESFSCVQVEIIKKEVAPHRKTHALYVDDKQGKQFSSLTNLVVGVAVPPRKCRIFQFHTGDYPGGRFYGSARSVVEMVRAARVWRDRESPGSPTVVVSRDGAARAGVYTVLSHCWDGLARDGRVDMAGAVRAVRVARPQLVTSLQEYSQSTELVTAAARAAHLLR